MFAAPGCIGMGDWLVGIYGVSLVGVSLQRAHESLLRKACTLALTRLALEVQVAPPPPSRPAHLLLELRKVGGDPSLGLSLSTDKDAVRVAALQPASAVHRYNHAAILHFSHPIFTVFWLV